MRNQILPFEREKCEKCVFLAVNDKGCDMIDFAAKGGNGCFGECLELLSQECPAEALLDDEIRHWRDDLSGLDIEILLEGALESP